MYAQLFEQEKRSGPLTVEDGGSQGTLAGTEANLLSIVRDGKYNNDITHERKEAPTQE